MVWAVTRSMRFISAKTRKGELVGCCIQGSVPVPIKPAPRVMPTWPASFEAV